ncbi:MAG: sugar ABC transporter substrate-binding protein [Chloroflexi bacterium]|nr:sugar ABC transporter substrate-binding protein [Chloroflexota bacterium]
MATNLSSTLSRRAFWRSGGAAVPLALAACGARDEGAAAPQSAAKPASIVYTQWGGNPIFELIDKANATYMQRFPQVKIRTEPNPDNYLDKMLTQIAAGTAPDLMLMTDRNLPLVAAGEGFENLDPYAAKTRSFKRDAYFPIGLTAGTLGGKLYSLPDVIDVDMVFYNRALFKEMGVKLPTATWTWDDLLNAAKAIHRDRGGTPLYGIAAHSGHWPSWVMSNGGAIFDEQGKRFLLDKPEAVDALQWLGDLGNRHQVVLDDAKKALGVDTTNSFGTSRVGMIFAEGWQFKYYRDPALDWQATMLPRSPKTTKVVPHGYVLGIGIHGQSKAKDAAWHWLSWWEGVEGWDAKIAAGWDKLPTAKQAATKKEWLIDVEGADRNKQAYVESALIAKGYPITKHTSEAIDAIGKDLGPAWKGEKTFKAVTTAMAEQINGILAK